MDSTILDVLEGAFGEELGLLGDLGGVEAAVSGKLRTLGRGLMQRILDRGGKGYVGSSKRCGCGGRKRFVSYGERQVHTTFGTVKVSRAYYRCESCGTSELAYDEESGLGPEGLSPALAKACCLLAVDDSFGESARKVEELLGQRVSANTIERVVQHVGGRAILEEDEELERFFEDREPPAAEAHPERLYVAADGTTVHEDDGWHEVKTGRVYWEEDGSGGGRRCRTVSRFEDSERFGWHLWAEACRCGLREADEVVFLGDGAGWIRTERRRHFGRATFIVDWYHASEHVWKCGKALYGEGTEETEAWSREREGWLWAGETGRLIEDLTEEIPRRRGARRKAVEELVRYVETNAREMRYAEFRSKGYDVGSGQAEGACKHVVGKRLKQSGMIWKRRGSSTTLALRVKWLNGQWHDFWAGKPLAA